MEVRFRRFRGLVVASFAVAIATVAFSGCTASSTPSSSKMKDEKMMDDKMKSDKMKDDKMKGYLYRCANVMSAWSCSSFKFKKVYLTKPSSAVGIPIQSSMHSIVLSTRLRWEKEYESGTSTYEFVSIDRHSLVNYKREIGLIIYFNGDCWSRLIGKFFCYVTRPHLATRLVESVDADRNFSTDATSNRL